MDWAFATGGRLFQCGIVRGKKEFFRASLYVWCLRYWALCDDLVVFKLWAGVIYSTGIAMLLSNVFCRDATRSAKKINPHANPALNPRNSRAKPSLFPRWNLAHVCARVATCRYDVASLSLIAVTHDYLCVEINHYSVRMMSVQALLKKNIVRLVKTAIEDY